MAKKKKNIEVKPYFHNDNIVCFYELEFKRDVIKPGEKIKFKGERGIFTFHKWVHHKEKDVRWIDCMEVATGRFRSIPVENLKGISRPKRSRRKKTDV
jgi:hypothetical protein